MTVKTTVLIDFHISCHSFHGCLILVGSELVCMVYSKVKEQSFSSLQ